MLEAVADIALSHFEHNIATRNGVRGAARIRIVPRVYSVDCTPTDAPMIAMDFFYSCKCAAGTAHGPAAQSSAALAAGGSAPRCEVGRSPLGAIVGPICPYAFAQVARFSQRWDVPVISGGIGTEFDNSRSEFPTLTRINGLAVRHLLLPAATAHCCLCKLRSPQHITCHFRRLSTRLSQ